MKTARSLRDYVVLKVTIRISIRSRSRIWESKTLTIWEYSLMKKYIIKIKFGISADIYLYQKGDNNEFKCVSNSTSPFTISRMLKIPHCHPT